ncbi:YlcI/YnfO family protein [Rhodoferax sp.]|uniref:YlcI/YnfO family protein n=1 Tax=Rhodoferax sp. TaxID=50421 RepID=UPI00272CE621|nr:YlcI/YnfO family protein [Rhodoferax sp.]
MHYNFKMKTATIPSIRVKPELRAQVEALLGDDESLSEFVETSVRESVQRRRNQAEFIARGIASLEGARRTGDHVDADVVIGSLERKLVVAKASKSRAEGLR